MGNTNDRIEELMQQQRRQTILRKARRNLERFWLLLMERGDDVRAELIETVLWPEP